MEIQVFSIKNELYPSIEKACKDLNDIQKDKEFTFKSPPERLKDKFFLEKREEYHSATVFDWLKAYRQQEKKDNQLIILLVDGYLKSNKLGNLFGTVSAEDGLAVFTVIDFSQFVNDIIRFCRYYLVRYALSFLEPTIKSHNDPSRKECIFHKKINKIELRDSLYSGHICQTCYDQLRPKLNTEISNSIKEMLLLVSNQHPFSIVIKGGGVKGLAFAGALLELENYFSFDTFAGTSAGAITAVLLGAGYKPNELLEILRNKQFKDFKDASLVGSWKNLIRKGGLYPGIEFENWLRGLLKIKIEQESKISISDLPYHTILYATKMDEGAITFDSKKSRVESSATFAARCSMSIPFFFIPKTIDDEEVVDGGVRNNFPLLKFWKQYPNNQAKTIALYLTNSKGEISTTFTTKLKKAVINFIISIIPGLNKNLTIVGQLINVVTDGEEKRIVDENKECVVIIDPSPIKTTDFNLNDMKKELLILSGRLGALKFIHKNYPDLDFDKDRIQTLTQQIDELKKVI